MTSLEWLDKRVRDGKGTLTFGLTYDGDIGIWDGEEGVCIGIGDTAEEALGDAAKEE